MYSTYSIAWRVGFTFILRSGSSTPLDSRVQIPKPHFTKCRIGLAWGRNLSSNCVELLTLTNAFYCFILLCFVGLFQLSRTPYLGTTPHGCVWVSLQFRTSASYSRPHLRHWRGPREH